jgi:SOS response regulatory protein OraA/RecX
MSKLLYIRDAGNALLLLGIDEEGECVRYTVSRTLYAELCSPARGEELCEDALCAIRAYDEHHRATKKALSLLSYSDKNEVTLRRRLMAEGFSRELASEISRDMVSLGYVNEERQLERLILNEANMKLKGPMKIIPALVGKGYSSEDVKRVMRTLSDSGELNFKENAKRLIEKRLPECDDSEEIKKLLYRNGYKV